MTLDEAIKHAEEVAEQNEWFEENYLEHKGCKECAEEHRQLAEWLKELKEYREQEPCDKCVYSTKDGYCQYDDISETIPPLKPCDDAVSRGVFEQVMWERNIAIEQLHELGYELGQKIEPYEDVISRQAALNSLIDNTHLDGYDLAEALDAIENKEKLPSVTQKSGKWIPVSERLPEEEIDVLVCNSNGEIEISAGSYNTEVENDFIWYTSGWRLGKVIAWMPLPKPYEPQESEV